MAGDAGRAPGAVQTRATPSNLAGMAVAGLLVRDARRGGVISRSGPAALGRGSSVSDGERGCRMLALAMEGRRLPWRGTMDAIPRTTESRPSAAAAQRRSA